MLQKDASLMASPWSPGWNSNQSISKFQEEINGELKQGSKGVLLCERQGLETDYETVSVDDGKPLSCFIIAHLFGSDEISANAPAIRARSVGAYACIGPGLAKHYGIRQHGLVELRSEATCVQLPVVVRSQIADNSVGIYPGTEIDKHGLLLGELTLSAVPELESNIASSRAMFDQLLINDALETGAKV